MATGAWRTCGTARGAPSAPLRLRPGRRLPCPPRARSPAGRPPARARRIPRCPATKRRSPGSSRSRPAGTAGPRCSRRRDDRAPRAPLRTPPALRRGCLPPWVCRNSPRLWCAMRKPAREARILGKRQRAEQHDRLFARSDGLGHLGAAAEPHQRIRAVQPARRQPVAERRRLVERQCLPQLERLVETGQRLGRGLGPVLRHHAMPRFIRIDACASIDSASVETGSRTLSLPERSPCDQSCGATLRDLISH